MTRRKEWDRREQLLGVGNRSGRLGRIATLSEVRGITSQLSHDLRIVAHAIRHHRFSLVNDYIRFFRSRSASHIRGWR